MLPVSVAFKTSQTALVADCPGNSGTKQEVPFTKSTLESHSLFFTAIIADMNSDRAETAVSHCSPQVLQGHCLIVFSSNLGSLTAF